MGQRDLPLDLPALLPKAGLWWWGGLALEPAFPQHQCELQWASGRSWKEMKEEERTHHGTSPFLSLLREGSLKSLMSFP